MDPEDDDYYDSEFDDYGTEEGEEDEDDYWEEVM